LSRRGLWLWPLLLVLLAAAAFGARQWWAARSTAAPQATPTSKALDLSPGDVVQARNAELSSALALTGSIKATSSAVVKARVAGELQKLTVREGEQVTAGQLIGQQDNTEYTWRLRQAQDQAAAAQATLDVAQKTLDNNKALVDQGFISRNALDTANSNTAGAGAQLQAAKAAAEIAAKAVRDSEVRAPISGLVSQRLAQPGERLGLDARIVEIVDLKRLELEAAIAPEDVVQLRVGQNASITVEGLAQAVPARVVRINPTAQSGSRTVLAYLEVISATQFAGSLRQGLFAQAQVDVQRKTALLVPATAVRLDQALPYVLTLENGQVTLRRITTGARGTAVLGSTAEPAVEVTSGLAAGATVLRISVGALREGTLLRLGSVTGGAAAPAAAAASRP
jgi:membrane fusion protein, multidrug efflux system